MSTIVISGAAGCGKTYLLMEKLTYQVTMSPLGQNQKILALTFMHGSRRRLNDRLASIKKIKGRYSCMTVDSFAWQICQRWRSLSEQLGNIKVDSDDYEGQCLTAAALLNCDIVQKWIALSFPVLLIDEGQDLSNNRLSMIIALNTCVTLLIACDEFQCLDEKLRPNPLSRWLQLNCPSIDLTKPMRTSKPGLLDAAHALRNGLKPISNKQDFRIEIAASVPLASAYVCNAIAWGKTKDIVVLTPSKAGGFSADVIKRVNQQACGKQQNGPYKVSWEQSDDALLTEISKVIDAEKTYTYEEALSLFESSSPTFLQKSICSLIHKKRWISGMDYFKGDQIVEIASRFITTQRQRSGFRKHGFLAMTVHQAKNREFDGVIVLWPYTVAGDSEHKRRILYNAVTRAKKWCLVLVQSPNLLSKAPYN